VTEGRAAVFLDRDGVLNDLVLDPRLGVPESPYRPEDVSLVPGAAQAVRALSNAGWPIVVVSNQPAAAKGTASLADLAAVHARVEALMTAAGARVDSWRYCRHHPDGVSPDLSRPCLCRKPRPGLLLAAADELGLDLTTSWMVGDTDTDIEAGVRAGCRTIVLRHPGSAHRRSGRARADASATDLSAVVSRLTR